MKRLTGDRVRVDRIDSHSHIGDLIRFEVPLLSLYSDGKRNWFYLWCDTDQEDTHRWWMFVVSRETLGRYVRKEVSLLDVLQAAPFSYVLDQSVFYSFSEKHEPVLDWKRRTLYRCVWGDMTEYLPAPDSYFDEDLAEDIEVTQELLPRPYDVPLNGEWFGKDFQYMFKTYENLYSFYYATRPRFVRTTRQRLGESLRAPWRGGHSRVNFYSALARTIPAQHALRVDELNFASPGEIEFEALPSVGESIRNSVLAYAENPREVEDAARAIRTAISIAKLNKVDLSLAADDAIGISETTLSLIKERCFFLATILSTREEFASLREYSPNTIVFGKAVLSYLRQLERLVVLQEEGMLDLTRRGRIK